MSRVDMVTLARGAGASLLAMGCIVLMAGYAGHSWQACVAGGASIGASCLAVLATKINLNFSSFLSIQKSTDLSDKIKTPINI